MSSRLVEQPSPRVAPHRSGCGLLIVNADDWGRNSETTDTTLECFATGAVSSVSAMVFMQDSERAAEIARARGIDAGLHLNFTTACSGTTLLAAGAEHHRRVSAYLRSNRLAQILYHPGLAQSFEYVVKAQIEEFTRLYGCEPTRFDGHHHMHLCANVIWSDLLPAGTAVRRNFSFKTGEKTLANRLYRRLIDRRLAQRHTMSDYFFSLPPLTPPSRLQQIFAVARDYTVELETHPVNVEERRYLTALVPLGTADNVRIASCYAVGYAAGLCGRRTVVE